MRAGGIAIVVLALAACGARTQLHAPFAERDASMPAMDAFHVVDGAVPTFDTGPPPPIDAWVCPATPAGFPVQLLMTETMRTTTLRTDVHIDTTPAEEPTPTIIAESWTWIARPSASTHLDLAHQADDTANWWIDNFILFEAFDCDGQRMDAAFVGFTNAQTVRLDGVPVRRIGRDSFEFTPNEISLDSLVPPGTPVHLHATALDYGAWVSLGDLWVIAR